MILEGKSAHGCAWLKSAEKSAAISVHGFAAEPAAGGRLSFFAPDFALSSATPWLVGEPKVLDLLPQDLPQVIHRVTPASADFAQIHEDLLNEIASGRLLKAVPVVCEELEFAEALRPQMFSTAIHEIHPHQFNYGFSFADEGMCGVTPEVLFSVADGSLKTMALAGTGRSDGPSLLDDTKELHEHHLVIENITQELKPWGQVEVGETRERSYGLLKHLYTPIQTRLERRPEFLPLCLALHPTAALGGWPRQAAVEWLERQKFHQQRRRFGAPFGYVHGDRMCCVVAIRGLQWVGTRAQLAVGCGVVARSQALREWDELRLKRHATERMLGLAP